MSKLPCIKPINLVKPQYRRLKQASIIKATSSQIIQASFFKWVKYPGIITIITIMIMIMMIYKIIIVIKIKIMVREKSKKITKEYKRKLELELKSKLDHISG